MLALCEDNQGYAAELRLADDACTGDENQRP
jgi:hypothetical protein